MACVDLVVRLVGCGAGNGGLPPAAQPKQAAQPNAPSAKPVPQDLPATESVKMSSELRVGLLLLPQ